VAKAVALARPRLRIRIKRPDPWRVYILLCLANALGWIACIVVQIGEHKPLPVLLWVILAIWLANFSINHYSYRLGRGLPHRPPVRAEWIGLFVSVSLQLFVWTTLF
jgi:hypothetical protein